MKMPDLQELIRRYGGYDKITAEAWAEWDREKAEWQQARWLALAEKKADGGGHD